MPNRPLLGSPTVRVRMILLAILPMLPPLWSASLGGGTTGLDRVRTRVGALPAWCSRWQPLLLPTMASASLPRRELPILGLLHGCRHGSFGRHSTGIRRMQAFPWLKPWELNGQPEAHGLMETADFHGGMARKGWLACANATVQFCRL